MFGYSLELEKKLDTGRDTTGNEGFKTSIKGFKTRKEAQQALEEAENEARMSNEYRVIESRIYEY